MNATTTTVAVDLAKTVFELAIANDQGRIIERKRLSREAFAQFFANRPPCRIVMEACGSAHYWARTFQRQGHTVKLLPPQYVRPYVRRNKTDRADAAALLEADRNDQILPVPVKSEEQQALQGLHRVRSGWMGTRTARINALRGLLREFGIVLPQGPNVAVQRVREILAETDNPVPPALRSSLVAIIEEIRDLENRIDTLETQLQTQDKTMPTVQQLLTIPGIGLLIATALVAAVGDFTQFRNGRHLAAWLGLTPRESSSGQRRRLGSVSKRGDPYLRMLLTHGARAVLYAAQRQASLGRKPLTRLQRWVISLAEKRGANKAVCALANKLARIAFSVVRHRRSFDGNFAATPATGA
ncbi:transposase [Gammaproteobacteria bacterium]